jgi:hypothetical protein
MKLEDQVCSLELSKKLKELGVKQESLFYWSKLSIQKEHKLEFRTNIFTQEIILADCTDYISAFTVSELGEMLPIWSETARRSTDDWVCISRFHPDPDNNYYNFGKSEANARAQMLIYLIENKLMEVNENPYKMILTEEDEKG